MYNVVANKQGAMTRDAFFIMSMASDDEAQGGNHFGKGILSPRHPTRWILSAQNEDYLVLGTPDDCRPVSRVKYFRCKAKAPNAIAELSYPLHVTEEYVTDVTYEVRTGTRLGGPFIPASHRFVITDEFQRQLVNSNLRGWQTEPITVRPGFSKLKLPRFHLMRFMGRACERPLMIVNAENLCPHCRKAQIVCVDCKSIFVFCVNCGEATWTTASSHKGTADKRLIICPPEDREPMIVDGNRWDGSDFNYVRGNEYGIISKRALNWLLSVHAAPFYATPIDFCTDGMTDQQRRWLAEVIAN
jgi:hypothetical protein